MGIYNKFNKRIQAEGRYEPLKFHREEVRRLLVEFYPEIDPKAMAWRIASFRFQPLDGRPHEIPMTEQIAEILRGEKSIPMTEQVPVVPVAPEAADAGDDEFWLDGDPDAPATPAVHTPATLGLPEPPRFGKDNKLTKFADSIGEKRMARKLDRDGEFDKLFATIDRKKRSKIHDSINWIYENMGTPPELIDPEEVPSAGALKHLQDCQNDPTVRADFRKTLYVKMIPDKKQLDHDSKQRDDGRPQLRLLDMFDAEFEAKEQENVA